MFIVPIIGVKHTGKTAVINKLSSEGRHCEGDLFEVMTRGLSPADKDSAGPIVAQAERERDRERNMNGDVIFIENWHIACLARMKLRGCPDADYTRYLEYVRTYSGELDLKVYCIELRKGGASSAEEKAFSEALREVLSALKLGYFSLCVDGMTVEAVSRLVENEVAQKTGKTTHKNEVLGNLSTKSWASAATRKNIALEKTPLRVFLHETDANRIAALKEIERLGLPRYRVVETKVGDFLSDPEGFRRRLRNRGNLYYPKIFCPNGARYFDLNCVWEKAVSFYEKQLAGGWATKDSRATLSEYFSNEYGFSILIGDEGAVLIEIVRGQHTGLGWGQKTPIFIARSDDLGIMRFKYPVTTLSDREAKILDMASRSILSAIPKTNTKHKRFGVPAPMPGYFEGVLVFMREEGILHPFLSPLFIDLRRENVYRYHVA